MSFRATGNKIAAMIALLLYLGVFAFTVAWISANDMIMGTLLIVYIVFFIVGAFLLECYDV